MRIAIDEINAFLMKEDMEIYLVVFDAKATALGERLYPDLEEYIDRHYVLDKRVEEYEDRYSAPKHWDDEEVDSYGRNTAELKEHMLNRKEGLLNTFMIHEKVMDKPTPLFPSFSAKKNKSQDEVEDELDYDSLEANLGERMQHISDTFSEYLMYLIQKKGLDKVQVYKDAILDKKFSLK